MPMITTTKGVMMDTANLRRTLIITIEEDQTTLCNIYRERGSDEIIHQSAHAAFNAGAVITAAAGSCG